MVTIRDISKMAGVSTATVSRTLSKPELVSEETRKKVQKAVNAAGYTPNAIAQRFRTKRSYTVVAAVPNIVDPFFSPIIKAMKQEAAGRGYAVLLGDNSNDSAAIEDYIALVRNGHADGMVLVTPFIEWASNKDIDKNIRNSIVHFSEVPYESDFPSVTVNNFAAMHKITTYLVQTGHKRIGLLEGAARNPLTKTRRDGWIKALKDADLPYDETLRFYGDFSMESGANVARKIAQSDNFPDAMACMSDGMAIGFISGMKGCGFSIPDDISVTGFDDIEVARYIDPPLTTMAQPKSEIGQTSMKILLNKLDIDDVTQQSSFNKIINLETVFTERGSVLKR